MHQQEEGSLHSRGDGRGEREQVFKMWLKRRVAAWRGVGRVADEHRLGAYASALCLQAWGEQLVGEQRVQVEDGVGLDGPSDSSWSRKRSASK